MNKRIVFTFNEKDLEKLDRLVVQGNYSTLADAVKDAIKIALKKIKDECFEEECRQDLEDIKKMKEAEGESFYDDYIDWEDLKIKLNLDGTGQ